MQPFIDILGRLPARSSPRLQGGLCVLLLAMLTAAPCAGAGYDLRKYYAQHQTKDFDAFLGSFPYDDYLSNVNFTDFVTLQKDRQFLRQTFGDGDAFLYHLGDRFVQRYPLDASYASLSRRTNVGVAYLGRKRGVSHSADELYQAIGYCLLGTVSHAIENAMAAGKFDLSSANNSAIKAELERHHVYVQAEECAACKVIDKVKEGDFQYLSGRLLSFLLVYKKAVIGGLLLALVTLLMNWVVDGITAFRGLQVAVALLMTLSIGGILFVTRNGGNQRPAPANPTQQVVSTWRLANSAEYYPIPGGTDHAVKVFKIQDASGNDVGQAIWLIRPALSASYLAYHDVYNRLQRARSTSSVVLATTGGFTNKFREPEGLTTEAGVIVNAVLMPDRHGLVIFVDGGIQVLDLKGDPGNTPTAGSAKEKTFRLPEGGPEITNPLNHLLAYSQLLGWAKAHKATMFQTQLLVFSDKILIDEKQAKPQLRERRLLALARDNRTQEVEHVVFNVQTYSYLTDVANEVYGTLHARNKKVEALLNLDVGTYDILDLYDPSGNVVIGAHGKVNAARATNLIVYSK